VHLLRLSEEKLNFKELPRLRYGSEDSLPEKRRRARLGCSLKKKPWRLNMLKRTGAVHPRGGGSGLPREHRS